MKMALVHDDLIQHGGAERLFEAMIEAFPQADIYTSMASEGWKLQIPNSKFQINPKFQFSKFKTSFMQHLPLKEKLYRHYFPLYPLAFESFDLTDYDVVFSSSTRFAHGVITRPETIHICYMNTPPRMFWEPHDYFSSSALQLFGSPLLSYLRMWDYAAAQRVDYFMANSKTPQARIKKYYGRDSQIIYPFVELERFTKISNLKSQISNPQLKTQNYDGYYLIVSRLAPWKRIDVAIEACNWLKLPLKIVGEGPDRSRLEKLAGPTVELLGRLTDEEVVRYYQNCHALIFPQKEDFGITPLEAMACGKPVIAFRAGGALETVIEGRTGEFFSPQTAEALGEVLKNFNALKYQGGDCRAQAEKFSKERFQTEIKSFVEEADKKNVRVL